MSIESLAKKYNKFQNDFGQGAAEDFPTIISQLFSPAFTKTANKSVLVPKRDDLNKQLTDVKGFAGNWSINETFLIPSADNTKCTIRYSLVSEKAGTFDVIAVLSSVDSQHIDSVDEIFYQVV